MVYKLNCNVAIFMELKCIGFGAIIRNKRGEVMTAMSVEGPTVIDSEEAEILACRKVMEFVVDAGFYELVVEGDNVNVMRAIYFPTPNFNFFAWKCD